MKVCSSNMSFHLLLDYMLDSVRNQICKINFRLRMNFVQTPQDLPPPPPLGLPGVSLSAAVSEHGFRQMLHALCALAYRRGRPWWDLPAPPQHYMTHRLLSSQPAYPQCPAAGGVTTLCEGDWWRRGALGEGLICRLIRQWGARRGAAGGQACVFWLLLWSLTNL